MITANQCKAARAMLGWSQQQLATESGINKRTIMDFESGARTPLLGTLRAIRAALETAGIEIIQRNGGGPGVRWADPNADQ